MRGQYSLFNSLISPNASATATSADSVLKKGRSYRLILERNECLLHRYYFYIKINRNQYADVIAILSSEFFLSQERIIICLNQNRQALKEVLAEAPDVKQLRSRYTWMQWN